MTVSPKAMAKKRTAFPIAGLTKAQRAVFEAIACGQQPFAHPKTIEALLSKGAIVRIEDRVVGRDVLGAITVPQYEVPFALHMAWCQWCSNNISDPDE